MTTNTTHSANPHLYKNLPYDPVKNFDPVVRIGTLPFMLLVYPKLPANTTAALLAYAKSNPGKLTYANSSSASLVSAETIKALGKVSIVGVQYKASPQALLDIMAGRVQVMVADFATAMPQVKAGKVRVLGVTTAKRSALLPDIPPIADTLPGFDVTSWNGLFVPAGTPKAIIARLERETLAILQKPDIRKRLAGLGYEVDPMPTQRFSEYVREQIAHWGRLIRTAGIQPE
jgi:tripartite-type tricarboxylate transporter receptor subunit TctC